MKKLLITVITVITSIASITPLIAQDVIEFPDINTLKPENIFQATVEPVYSALILLFGYLSAFIPGIKRLNTYLRVLSFGLIAGLGFYLFGGASIWKVALTYLISTGLLYDGFFKPLTQLFKKTPSAATK